MLGAWCPWVMLSQEHRLRFYKEPLEDPVQTLQPGLGFYLHKEAMHGTFPAVKISSLSFQKKKNEAKSPANCSTYKLAAEVRLPDFYRAGACLGPFYRGYTLDIPLKIIHIYLVSVSGQNFIL